MFDQAPALCYNSLALASVVDGEVGSNLRPSRVREWGLIVGLMALAAALRVVALGEIPPGLYHDEAFNGLDALNVLAGQGSIYFAANHGREPLFVYLTAATVGLFGRSPGALRLAAAVCGTLTIPATYALARAWFGRRIGLLSAAILTITLWHVHLSRIGFRAVTLPLTAALALWLGTRAYRSQSRRDWLLAGLSYGVCFYAYLPARFTPVALAAFAATLLIGGRGRSLWPGVAWFAAGTAGALIPLGIYAAAHWDVVLGRLGQVSILNPLVNGGDPWGALLRQLAATLGMFFVRGDSIARHNVPGRPVFDLLLGAAMVWGLARAVLRARREAASALTLIWVGSMLVPTWLAEDAPHFLRAVGVLPVATLLPALGLDGLATWLKRRRGYAWAALSICLILAASLGMTVRDYFVRYRADARTAYAFEAAATELAVRVNRFAGTGWDGSGLTAAPGDPLPERRAYVDDRLWEEWEAIPFLVPESQAVAQISQASPSEGEHVLLALWPYPGIEAHQHLLPRGVRIEAHEGPLTRGDLEDEPYIAFVTYVAEPVTEPSGFLARLGEEIALVDYSVRSNGQGWQVQLEWQALAPPTESYTVFVHLRQGDEIVAQDDGEPADGCYPTRLWRTGDRVVDTHQLVPPHDPKNEPRILTGLYIWSTKERLEVVSQAGQPLGDELELELDER